MTGKARVVLLDSGGANLGSVRAAFARMGVDAPVSSDWSQIRAASHVVLPGVGAAAACMARLRENGVEVHRGHLRHWQVGLHDIKDHNFRAKLLRERHSVGERLFRAVRKINWHENALQFEECFNRKLHLVRTEFDEHAPAIVCGFNFHKA